MALQADLDVLAQCEHLLMRAGSPRLGILHAVALSIAELEAGETRRTAPVEKALVS